MAPVTEMSKVEKIGGVDKYDAEYAADTLTKSFEIKKDKKLLAAALTVIRRRQDAAKKALGWAGKLGK